MCAVCGKPPPSQAEVELSKDGRWLCSEHIDKRYGLHLLDYIKTRIAVTKTEDEDQSKFVLRELVQNADDAYASILVVRFEKDGLYVANDGRAFTTEGPDGQPGDFERAALVLKRFKEDEKESAGHFGSGFQTVYAITNRPEVHSNGISRALNPADMTWEDIAPHRYSPYMNEPSRKGVLFRLPWRDDKAAEKSENGDFQNRNYWPRWDSKSIRSFYEDTSAYLHSVILCCQRIKIIRVIWALAGPPECYQAERNFALDRPIARPTEVEVLECGGPENARYYQWDQGLSEADACPQSFNRNPPISSPRTTFRYLAQSSKVEEDNAQAFLVKDPNGNVKVKDKVPDSWKEIKKNFVHLLFPLFLLTVQKQFLYSVIPLPRRGSQGFVFSAHFIPTEDRKDVDIEGNFEMNGRWYRLCMFSIAKLYEKLFPIFLESVSLLNAKASDRQALILQMLPTREIGEWMRPGREDLEWARSESEKLYDWLFDRPILQTREQKWASPSTAFSVETETERGAVETLGITVYPREFAILARQVPWLRIRIEKKRFNVGEFARIWKSVCEINGPQNMRYGKVVKLPPPGINVPLAQESISKLLAYAISSGGKESTRLTLIPDYEGILRDFYSFPKLPKDFQDFEPLFSLEQRIHSKFVEQILEAETKHPIRTEIIVADLPYEIAKQIDQQPERFQKLNTGDHGLLSRAVVKIVLHKSFAPNQAVDKAFLPIRFEGELRIGSPPDVDNQHTGEKYQREWVFAHQSVEVRGMTPEIKRNIRFLELKDIPETQRAEVESSLNIVALAENPDQPVNFVRHFISALHGTLFDDDALSKFLGRKDDVLLTKQKTSMLDAVQTYFKTTHTERWLTQDSMGEIPCLYDENREWHPANEFAVGAGTLLTVLEFRKLHADFKKWPNDTLKAIGVASGIDSVKLAKRISELTNNPRTNRSTLASIVGAFIAGFEKSTDIARALSETDWVPVLKNLARSSEVLYPSESNKEIVGENYSKLLDLNAMDESLRSTILEMKPSDRQRNLEELGFSPEPTREQMSQLILECSSRDIEPPMKLIQTLARSLSRLSPNELEDWKKQSMQLKFYWEKHWYPGERIRVLSEPLESGRASWSTGVLMLNEKEAVPFAYYLDAIGAAKGLGPQDFLDELGIIAESAKRAPDRISELQSRQVSAWLELERVAGRMSAKTIQQFRDKPLFLAGRRWYSASSVLINDLAASSQPITFGEACIIPLSGAPKESLRALGAKLMSELSRNSAFEFLSKCARTDTITDEQSEAYLRILLVGVERGWWNSREIVRWPCLVSPNIRFRLPAESYLANSSLQSFVRNVPFLVTSTESGFHDGLENLARTWGAKDLHRIIRYEKFPETSARDIELQFAEIYVRLAQIFPSNVGALEWLKGLKVFRSNSRILRFAIENRSGIISLPALVPIGNGQSALVISEDDGLTSPASNSVAAWAVGLGFPPGRLAELASMILMFLTDLEYQDVLARQIPGYYETMSILTSLYPGCQICGSCTPKNQSTGETMESIKSVISDRGGLLKGKLVQYELGNSLYLCPRHAILMTRGLVGLDFLKNWENNRRKATDAVRSALDEIRDKKSLFQIPIQVYEGNFLEDKKTGWQPLQLSLDPSHGKELFGRLLKHLG